jgi:hypothetical protein
MHESDRRVRIAAARKAAERVQLRADAAAKRRSLQRRSLYTYPLQPKAGDTIDIFYNPNTTNLAGRNNVYARGGWNRWTHPQPINSILMSRAAPEIPWLKVHLRDSPVLLLYCFGYKQLQSCPRHTPQSMWIRCVCDWLLTGPVTALAQHDESNHFIRVY